MRITKHLLAKNTKYETPYYIVNGDTKGNTIMVTAGVHGSERAGILAAKKLLGYIQRDIVHIHSGKLIIVPIVNQVAFKRRKRGKPDLNRTFPTKQSKAARHPLSRAVFQLAKRQKAAWYIDLHEANGLSSLNPRALGQTLITNPGSQAIPPAKQVIKRMNGSIRRRGRHFSILVRELDGSGRSAAYHLLKAKAITVETGIGLPIKDRVSYQMNILRTLLKAARLTSNKS
ncbi:succinylglutamate desuccinylase/aspartoacylase domain-containing protein [Paenibacillus sp. UNC451MF]|uniref:succinylglutamate desuccinylase/aspartoacylase domain-containing protein n=1 Tax=Paenibacillus sp. UNC451MF TaxID=1449063 RepID=UPI0004917B48|nr:succinylglutamate desuccinylase/aspartoacylase family protein [Paenibacillus sp. UNC451MF]